jgi:hypothetical protein
VSEQQGQPVEQLPNVQVPPGAVPGQVVEAEASRSVVEIEAEALQIELSRQEYRAWRQTLGWDQRLSLVEDAIDEIHKHVGDDAEARTLKDRLEAVEQRQADAEKAAQPQEQPQAQPAQRPAQ